MVARRFFLTGGAGFIGTHLTEALLQSGGVVALYEKRDKKKDSSRKGVHLYPGDVRDEKVLGSALRHFRPDMVFHLAAVISKEESVLENMFETNVRGTLNLVNALSTLSLVGKRPRLVNLGTLDECVGGEVFPVDETSREVPISFYGLTKLMETKTVEFAMRHFGLATVTVRTSIVYGPGQEGSMFIPDCITTLLRGETFNMSPGTQKRDFLYIDDLVSGLMALRTKTSVKGVVHLASGRPVSLSAVAAMIEAHIGLGMVKRGARPLRNGEVMVHAIDSMKAKKMLSWEPRVTLQEGLRMTVEWNKSRLSSLDRMRQKK